MTDEYNLRRFIVAQDPIYSDAIEMLRRGTMRTAYMEIVFPTPTPEPSGAFSRPYAISSLDEACAFLASPILGGRYRQCVATLQGLHELSVTDAFGEANARRLHASLTLFSEAAREEFLLETMFDVWFDGLVDEETMVYLGSKAPALS